MKAKVIIENGETQITLTPENEFEIDLIEKVNNTKKAYNIHTCFDAKYSYGNYTNHEITMNIKEIKP